MSSKGATIDKAAGRRFALVRKHLGLDTVQMGEACGVAQSTISRIEHGTRDISQSIFKTLYIKYNISPIYIIAGGVSMAYKQ